MLDCTQCKWASPETCRLCKIEQMEREEELARKMYGIKEQVTNARKPTVMDLIVGLGRLEFLEVDTERLELN